MRLYTWSRRYPIGVSIGFWGGALLWVLLAPLVLAWAVCALVWRLDEPSWFKLLVLLCLLFLVLWLGH